MSLSKLLFIAANLSVAVSLQSASAQSATAPKSPAIPSPTETMVVLGSAAPVPLAESPRSVVVLPLEGKKLAAESPQDFLRQDSSIFLEERGAGGGQADIVLARRKLRADPRPAQRFPHQRQPDLAPQPRPARPPRSDEFHPGPRRRRLHSPRRRCAQRCRRFPHRRARPQLASAARRRGKLRS